VSSNSSSSKAPTVPVFEFCPTLTVQGTIGVGCWAWNRDFDSPQWGKLATAEQDALAAFKASVDAGVTFFDTAEVYAAGQSEEIVGAAVAADAGAHRAVVATKFLPMPNCVFASALSQHLDASLARLKLPAVDLYQVHGMLPSVRSVETWMEELVKLHKAGKVKHVGVSNFTPGQVERAHRYLAQAGIPLVSNQIEYSLLRRAPETNGVIDMCQRLNIRVIAYSPLGMGRLSGKYSSKNPPPSGRQFAKVDLGALDRLLDVIRAVAKEHSDDVTPSQVSLAWCVAKGAFPISGARNEAQARENALAMHVLLTADQVARLDEASLSCQAQPGLFERLWQD
jgi:aryl-alcohol dehydrogenase-like predicted oxidoreductase